MTLLLEPLHKDCLYSLQPPKPAESRAADSVLTVLTGGCTCGGEEMEQLHLINSNPDSCNLLLCLLMGHSGEHMCIQKFPGNYSLEVATIWLWRSREQKVFQNTGTLQGASWELGSEKPQHAIYHKTIK